MTIMDSYDIQSHIESFNILLQNNLQISSKEIISVWEQCGIKMKECCTCKQILYIEKFVPSVQKFVIGARCKGCDKLYITSLRGFLISLLTNARHKAKYRLTKGRVEASTFSLDIELLLEMWNEQAGRCAYSGIPLSHQPLSQWKASIERVNPSKGYIKENIILVCSELNSTSQWSTEKLQQFLLELEKPQYNENETIKLIEEAEKKPMIRKEMSEVHEIKKKGLTYRVCRDCKKAKLLIEYNKNTFQCKMCQKVYTAKYRSTIRGFLSHLVTTAKDSRATKRFNGICDLQLKDLLEIVKIQKGLCAYSGIQLRFIPNHDWRTSLERLDITKPYSVDNVVLICLEFNTTMNTDDNNQMVGGWNLEKMQTLISGIMSQNIQPSVTEWTETLDIIENIKCQHGYVPPTHEQLQTVGYKHSYIRRDGSKYRAQICHNKKIINCGTYSTPDLAAWTSNQYIIQHKLSKTLNLVNNPTDYKWDSITMRAVILS